MLRREHGASFALSTVHRFLARHRITLKKSRARRRAGPAGRGRTGGRPGSTRSLTSIPSAWCSSTRPARRPRWPGCAAGHLAASAAGPPCLTGTGRPRPSWARCAWRHDGADGAGRADERPCLPGLCRAGARAHAAARDDTVVMDNLPAHKVAACGPPSKRPARACGCCRPTRPTSTRSRTPSPSSRHCCARRRRPHHSGPLDRHRRRPTRFTPAECANYFTACGYEPE